MIVPISARLATVAALIAEDGLLDGAKVILFQNDFFPDEFTTLAQLTEATFTGYARSAAVVWGTPYVTAGTLAAVTPPSVQFNSTGTTVTNIIYGWAVIHDDTVDTLQYAQRLDEPVSMDGVGNAIIVQPTYTFPS